VARDRRGARLRVSRAARRGGAVQVCARRLPGGRPPAPGRPRTGPCARGGWTGTATIGCAARGRRSRSAWRTGWPARRGGAAADRRAAESAGRPPPRWRCRAVRLFQPTRARVGLTRLGRRFAVLTARLRDEWRASARAGPVFAVYGAGADRPAGNGRPTPLSCLVRWRRSHGRRPAAPGNEARLGPRRRARPRPTGRTPRVLTGRLLQTVVASRRIRQIVVARADQSCLEPCQSAACAVAGQAPHGMLRRRFEASLRRLNVDSYSGRLQRLGSDYGGWVAPVDLINETWTCYCVDAGSDVTFDLALLRAYRARSVPSTPSISSASRRGKRPATTRASASTRLRSRRATGLW
jgi:hypothetical protein